MQQVGSANPSCVVLWLIVVGENCLKSVQLWKAHMMIKAEKVSQPFSHHTTLIVHHV